MSELVRRRPALLLLTMLMAIVMGWGGVFLGCNNIQYYRSPVAIEEPLAPRPGQSVQEHEEMTALLRARDRVLDRDRPVRLPMSIADLLLSGLLIVAATRAFGGRRGSRELALQAVLANAALTVVDYAMSRGLRGDLAMVWAEHYPRSAFKDVPTPPDEHMAAEFFSNAAWGFFRLQLALTLLAYGIAIFALLRKTTRAYLAPLPGGAQSEGADLALFLKRAALACQLKQICS